MFGTTRALKNSKKLGRRSLTVSQRGVINKSTATPTERAVMYRRMEWESRGGSVKKGEDRKYDFKIQKYS